MARPNQDTTSAAHGAAAGSERRRPLVSRFFLFVAVAGVVAWAANQQESQEPAPAEQAAEESKFPKGYIGTETCALCHEDVVEGLKKNAHSMLETNQRRGWAERACESCHGPGEAHAESASADDIRNPLKLRPAEADKGCLSCHRNQPTHIGRIQNGHARGQVACVSCHNVHKTGEESTAVQQRRASGINKQCATCHLDVWASFQKPHRHRLNEGAMSCVSCHNPHGSILARNMRTAMASEPGCFSCHADKRGPFVHEHAPVRNQPCSTCHEPHGSSNPRMLTRHEVANQCLECHANLMLPSPAGVAGGVPPAIHDLRLPRWRQCTMCHQKIHGSHVSRGLLR